MIPDLTRRQREVLILKANGNTRQQIADWLGIKIATVSSTLQRIYRTLGVSNDVQAVAVAIAIGEIGIHEITIPDQGEKEAA